MKNSQCRGSECESKVEINKRDNLISPPSQFVKELLLCQLSSFEKDV